MVLSTGIDILGIDHLAFIIGRYSRGFDRMVFTDRERTCSGDDPEKLALLFGCKEAVAKSLGVGFHWLHPSGVDPREIEIRMGENNEFEVQLAGKAKQLAHNGNIDRFHVSCSACSALIIAVSVAVSA